MSWTVRNQSGRGVLPNPGWRGATTRKRARQPVEKRPVLRDIVAAMQKQQRRPAAGDLGLERNAADLDAFHARLPCHCERSEAISCRQRCAVPVEYLGLRRLRSSQ